MTNNIKTNIDTQATIAIIASVCGLHKFNNVANKNTIIEDADREQVLQSIRYPKCKAWKLKLNSRKDGGSHNLW